MIYTFLANGFEELEAVATIDILKRANFDVKVVGVDGEMIVGAHGITIKSDVQIKDAIKEKLEAIVLPGGMPGTTNLYNNQMVRKFISHCVKNNILIGAICAAPTILGKLGLLKNKKACCYPGCENDLIDAIISHDPVCVDGNIITSKGPGTSLEFGFALVEYLKNEEVVNSLKGAMQCL